MQGVGVRVGVGVGVGVNVAVAVGVRVDVGVGLAVALGVGVGLAVGVGVGVPPAGPSIATVIGDPVLKKPTVASAFDSQPCCDERFQRPLCLMSEIGSIE